MELNNREISMLIWLLLICIFLMWKKETRSAIANILIMLFASKVTFVLLIMLIYTCGIVCLLYSLGWWDLSQLKNTILWFVTVAFVSLFEIKKEKKNNFLLRTLKEILKVTVIVEFLVGLYPFSLAAELLIVPSATMLTIMNIYSENKPEYEQVHKFLSNLLAFLGLCLIGYALFSIVRNFHQFSSITTLNDFLISPVLSLMYVPFLYLLSLFVIYETAFVSFDRAFKNSSLKSFAKRQAILHFRFNKSNLQRWQQTIFRENYSSKREIIQSIKKIKSLQTVEKNPPPVPYEIGWSPYKAKDFLKEKGLTTGFYSNVCEEEWFASSTYFELDKASILSNNIAYYVSGTEKYATELKLVLNVNEPAAQNKALEIFIEFIETLFKAALNTTLDKTIRNSIISKRNSSEKFQNRIISIKKENFQNSKHNGYSLDLTIKTITS